MSVLSKPYFHDEAAAFAFVEGIIWGSEPVCPHCGVATGHFPQVVAQGKSRTSFILFGALLGLIGLPGIHNFYAGYNQKGLVQILVSVLSCWLLWIPMYIWTIVEICTVTVDSDGKPMY